MKKWKTNLDSGIRCPYETTKQSILNEIKSANPKGNQSWILIRRTDGEIPILWLPDAKSWLFIKDSDAEKVWRQKKGMTEVGWHHRLSEHECEQAPGDGEGHGSVAWVRHNWVTEQLTTKLQASFP